MQIHLSPYPSLPHPVPSPNGLFFARTFRKDRPCETSPCFRKDRPCETVLARLIKNHPRQGGFLELNF